MEQFAYLIWAIVFSIILLIGIVALFIWLVSYLIYAFSFYLEKYLNAIKDKS